MENVSKDLVILILLLSKIWYNFAEVLVKTCVLLAFFIGVELVIIFSCLKKEFDWYVSKGEISNKVYDAFKEKMGKRKTLNQIKSWANSLPFMASILTDLPDDVRIAIEYNIPLTSKRVDFVVSGYNKEQKPVLILLELKQWQNASDVKNQDAIVKTVFSGKEQISLHPSYQVSSYQELLLNYNLFVYENEGQIIPLVYLHNYCLNARDDLFLNKFKKYYRNAPIYGKQDAN